MQPAPQGMSSANDLEAHKQRIRQLYIERGRTLPQVMKDMEDLHGFHATYVV